MYPVGGVGVAGDLCEERGTKMKYFCADCGEAVEMNHKQFAGEMRGLGTATCRKHRIRYTTVTRDLSGGKEADKGNRNAPVTVKRHTRVRATR